VGMTVEK
jgi:hypothetical protein